VSDVRIDPFGIFGSETSVDLTQFAFDVDPTHDSSKLSWMAVDLPAYMISGYVGAAWLPFPEHARAAQVTYEAGFWAADDPNHVSNLPYDLRGRLVKRVRVEFKRANGIKDDETEKYSGNMFLRELEHYRRA
jgi:hypothetical protein